MRGRRLSRGLPVVYHYVGHGDLLYETSVRPHIAERQRPALNVAKAMMSIGSGGSIPGPPNRHSSELAKTD